jgi:putative membrane protein
MSLLNEAVRKRIEATIADIEQRTAAELVVVSVERSDGYLEVRLGYAFAAALLCGATAHMLWPLLSVLEILWAEVGVAVAVFALTAWGRLLRIITPRHRAQHCVERRALLAFVERAVFATRDRSGVLILLSELERRVVILGDSGIHARVQTTGWQAYVQEIVAAIRGGRAGDGVCDVLNKLAETLARDFPPRPDDQNELPNQVTESKL